MHPAAILELPALRPLKDRVYRGLWLAWLTANLTMWMHDVSAAWLMTQPSGNPNAPVPARRPACWGRTRRPTMARLPAGG